MGENKEESHYEGLPEKVALNGLASEGPKKDEESCGDGIANEGSPPDIDTFGSSLFEKESRNDIEDAAG